MIAFPRATLLPSVLFAELLERARDCFTVALSRRGAHALYTRRFSASNTVSIIIIGTGDLLLRRAARTGSIERSPVHSPLNG